MPRQVFTAGEILTAANMNDLSDQTVMVFDSSAARGSAIPTPAEGMVTYLKDTNQVSAFNGSAFAPLGTILQVVQTVKTDTFTSSSASFTNVTGLTASITPSATSSKILIWADIKFSIITDQADRNAYFRLSGGNATTYVGDASGSFVRSATSFGNTRNFNANIVQASNLTYLDSPNTTSATTYAVQGLINNATSASFCVNRQGGEDFGNASGRYASSITLMEVAG